MSGCETFETVAILLAVACKTEFMVVVFDEREGHLLGDDELRHRANSGLFASFLSCFSDTAKCRRLWSLTVGVQICVACVGCFTKWETENEKGFLAFFNEQRQRSVAG